MINNMHNVCNDRLIKTLKEIVAYLFLYGVFLGTLYDFAYDAWICAKPIGLMLVLLKALGFLFLYALVNHIIIRKIVGLKTVVIFETILFLVFFVLSGCYAAIENRFHGDYSAPIPYEEVYHHKQHSEERMKEHVAGNIGTAVNNRLDEKFLICR